MASPDPQLVALATRAYLAGSPLLVSCRTLDRLGGLLGANHLFWQPALSDPSTRVIVVPNRDTLYAVAVLDLRGEPQVLSLPDVVDRYHSFQLLDAWTESFAYLGTRATGGQAGSWAITPPGWDGTLPDGVEEIRSPTPQVFLLGRFLVDGADDVAAVHAIAARSSLAPLSSLTGSPAVAPPPLDPAAGSPQSIPSDASFFDELGDALARNPPSTPTQQSLFDSFGPLGIGPGRHPVGADTEVDAALDAGAAAGARLVLGEAAETGLVNGWLVRLDVGRYGDDIDTRAIVAHHGWGANIPEEAVYPVTRVDAAGERLHGRRTYRMRFAPGSLPSVDAFWSLTVYGTDLFFTPHPSDRYHVSDRDLVAANDGSLEIVLSHDEPVGVTNWLPVPADRFVLMLRLYLPRGAVLDGTYAYPAVEPIG